MAGMSASRIGGFSLPLGAILGLVVMLIRPGSLLIEPLGRGATLLERVRALADNAAFTHISPLLGAFGLLLLLFGFFTVRRAMSGRDASDAFTRFGVLLLTFAVIALASTYGMNHTL